MYVADKHPNVRRHYIGLPRGLLWRSALQPPEFYQSLVSFEKVLTMGTRLQSTLQPKRNLAPPQKNKCVSGVG